MIVNSISMSKNEEENTDRKSINQNELDFKKNFDKKNQFMTNQKKSIFYSSQTHIHTHLIKEK